MTNIAAVSLICNFANRMPRQTVFPILNHQPRSKTHIYFKTHLHPIPSNYTLPQAPFYQGQTSTGLDKYWSRDGRR